MNTYRKKKISRRIELLKRISADHRVQFIDLLLGKISKPSKEFSQYMDNNREPQSVFDILFRDFGEEVISEAAVYFYVGGQGK